MPQRYARLLADVDAKVRRGAWYKVVATDGLNAAPARRAKLGERYGVCPSCGERAPLAKKPKRLQCAHCKWEFEVAWSESYLAK